MYCTVVRTFVLSMAKLWFQKWGWGGTKGVGGGQSGQKQFLRYVGPECATEIGHHHSDIKKLVGCKNFDQIFWVKFMIGERRGGGE
jgi:hypothetical protein